MAVLFAANNVGSFEATSLNTTTTSATYRKDTGFAPSAVRGNAREAPLGVSFVSAVAEGWLHYVGNDDSSSTNNMDSTIVYLDAANGDLALRFGVTDRAVRIEAYNGSSWESLGTGADYDLTTISVDVHWKLADSGGIFDVFIDGVAVLSYSGDTLRNGVTEIGAARILSARDSTTAGNAYYSEIIAADEPTIGWRCFTASIEADGTTNTLETGAYDQLNGEGDLDDSTFASALTDGQLFFAQLEDGPAGDLSIKAVAVNTRARATSDAAPQNLDLAIRAGGTNYFAASQGLGLPSGAFSAIWDENPSTTADWLLADVNALEAGFRAVT